MIERIGSFQFLAMAMLKMVKVQRKYFRRDERGRITDTDHAKTVTVITPKKASGHIGSYEVRTVDSSRFKIAKQAASSTLKSRTKT